MRATLGEGHAYNFSRSLVFSSCVSTVRIGACASASGGRNPCQSEPYLRGKAGKWRAQPPTRSAQWHVASRGGGWSAAFRAGIRRGRTCGADTRSVAAHAGGHDRPRDRRQQAENENDGVWAEHEALRRGGGG